MIVGGNGKRCFKYASLPASLCCSRAGEKQSVIKAVLMSLKTLIEELEEDKELNLSSFSCSMDEDIEHFLHRHNKRGADKADRIFGT